MVVRGKDSSSLSGVIVFRRHNVACHLKEALVMNAWTRRTRRNEGTRKDTRTLNRSRNSNVVHISKGGKDMNSMRSTIHKMEICLIVLLVMVGLSVPCRAADLGAGETSPSTAVSQYLHDWTVTGYASAYKDVAATVDVSSLSIAGSEVTAEALVAVTMTLKDKSVSDIPAIQGMLSQLGMTQYDPSVSLAVQLPASKEGLTEQEQTHAEAQLRDWYKELSGYINTPFTGYLSLTLKGKLLPDGHLDESSVQLLIADGSDLVPAESVLPHPAAEREQEGVAQMKDILQGTTVSIASSAVAYTYDRIAARDYADKYTSTVTASPYYNTSYWNTAYSWYTSGDCVNYVSQALTAGGLPHDSSWKPYTSYWLSLSYFLPHMISVGYFVASDYTWANAGGVRIFVVDGVNSHIVMITRNDLTTRWYSGHTNDEKQAPYGDQANRLYYVVAGA